MGAGAGISMHTRFRVVTEKTVCIYQFLINHLNFLIYLFIGYLELEFEIQCASRSFILSRVLFGQGKLNLLVKILLRVDSSLLFLGTSLLRQDHLPKYIIDKNEVNFYSRNNGQLLTTRYFCNYKNSTQGTLSQNQC